MIGNDGLLDLREKEVRRHLSNFFRKRASRNPTAFRKEILAVLLGKGAAGVQRMTDLACRRIGSRQPAVRGAPDTADTAARADEQRRGCQTDKSQQQRVLDQILTLFVLDEIVKKRRHF